MAVLTTKLDTTAVTEGIPADLLGEYVASFEYNPMTFEAVSWAVPGQGTIVRRFIRWDELDGGSGVPSGTKSETDVYTDVTLTAAESSITPGFVGMRLPISDEADMNWSVGALKPQAIDEALFALLDRMDSDGLSSSTSATNTVGAATDNFTTAKFRAAAAAYRTLIKNAPSPLGNAFIGHFDAFRDLEESIGSSAAVFTNIEASEQLFGSRAGYKGRYHGFEMFETGNVPSEGGGWSNGMTPIGPRASGLGTVITRLPTVVPTRGDDAEVRKVTYLVIDAVYGSGLTNPSRYQEVLSRT